MNDLAKLLNLEYLIIDYSGSSEIWLGTYSRTIWVYNAYEYSGGYN